MNQRIAVRAIIRNDDRTLLLRRANGRPSIIGTYELPGGRVQYQEQPEQAVTRYVHEDTGLKVRTAQLFDTMTYIDHDDRDIQYVIIIFLVSLASEQHKVRLGQNYDHYVWKKMSQLHQVKVTESTQAALLARQSPPVLHTTSVKFTDDNDTTPATTAHHLIIYSDGGSRGNPGPSAAGFVVMDSQQRILQQGGDYLGITTNNQAEYQGVRLGLEVAQEMGARTVDFRIDSMLVVNQMNGLYKIKNRELWPIHERIVELLTHFERVSFTHVRREFNQLADGMVNKILNQHADEAIKLV